MSEWWTYTLSDLLMFSPRTYYRLVERYNAALWPAQVLSLGLGILVAVLLRRPGPRSGRATAGILAVAWAWVGWAFLLERYAGINWPARWFAALFAVEAVLLAWTGVRAGGTPAPSAARRGAGLALVGLGLALYPLLGPLLGRGWATAEVFGLMPEPTALVTTGALLAERRRSAVLAVPLLWLAIAGLTLYAMGSAEAWIMALCLVVATGALAWPRTAWESRDPG